MATEFNQYSSVKYNLKSIGLFVTVMLSLSAFQSQADETVYEPRSMNTTGGSQWPSYNQRLDGQRFSTLDEITLDNVNALGTLCSVQIDGPTTFNAGLIVVDGIIYTNTGHVTAAIEADTCAIKWLHTYVPEDDEIVPSSRGPAVLNGRVFRGTGDGRLIALDAETGQLLWKNIIATPRLSEFAAAAPLAWQGVVYMGVAGGDRGIRGRVMAFDAISGRELWRFNTIPMGDEFGAETWERPLSAKTGGGGVWGAMTLDVTTAELFIPVGNPWPDIDRSWRPGSNLFTNSIVVLDANTGKLKWWHQATPDDAHDLDLAAAPVLYRDSQIRDVIAFAGKDGFVVSLDRDSHETIFRTPITRIENPTSPATEEGTLICPGFAGGVQWNGPTLDRMNNNLITGVVDLCMVLHSGPVEYAPPSVSYGGYPRVYDDPKGSVVALDTETGKEKWHYRAEKPVVAGVTPTAGGITFTGDLAGNLLVLNSENGELVHKVKTQGALAGGVVTYTIEGKQYVAVASGNVSRTAFGALGLPSVVIMTLNPDSKPVEESAQINNGPDLGKGRALYRSICASCHGPDGAMIADHNLSTVAERLSHSSTVDYIKNPVQPMPKLFPSMLSAQDVENVSAYLHQGMSR